jgi:PTH1 family peptidyl-tRNA hydrolase
MRSVVDAIGSSDFPRLRIGIGRPPSSGDEVEYVLGPMSSEDRENVDAAVRRASEALVCLFAEGIDAAMGRFNS